MSEARPRAQCRLLGGALGCVCVSCRSREQCAVHREEETEERRGEGATPDTFHPPTPGHAAAPAQAEEQQEEEMRLRNGTFLTLLAFCFCIFLSLSWYTAFSGQKGENPTPWTISATSCVSAILLGRPLTAGGTYKFSLLCDGWVVISVIRRMERRRRVLDPWAQV